MKLSEAMMKGILVTEKTEMSFVVSRNGKVLTCALGAAMVATVKSRSVSVSTPSGKVIDPM